MAELKPVPSGYDSAALSSMLGYLANARKSHDNNPFMRTILDGQARDNKAEYLADADLTRGLQQGDNANSHALNLAKLAQDAYDARMGRATTMNTTSGGGLVSDELAAEQGLSMASDEGQNAVLSSLAQAAALKGRGAQADIQKTVMDTAAQGMNIGVDQVNVGQDAEFDIMNPTRIVKPDITKRPDIIESAAQGQNAAVVTASNSKGGTFFQDVAVRRDPNDPSRLIREDILPSEIAARKAKGEEIVSEERRVQSTTGSRGRPDNTTSERPKSIARPANDLARAEALLAQSGGMIDGKQAKGLRFNGDTKQAEALIDGQWIPVGEVD